MAKKKIDINNPKFHSVCLLFPEFSEEELQNLAEDIRQNGLQEDIVTLNGEILDGRNRLRACKLSGVKPRFVEWKGEGSPLNWVISKNMMRRHLSASQRAALAFGLLPHLEAEAKERQRLSRGSYRGSAKCATMKGKASDQAARIANSSERAVQMVKAIHREAPELVEKILAGSLNVAEATRLAKLPADERDYGKFRTFGSLQSGFMDVEHEPQSEFSTPTWLFDLLDAEFNFKLDAAASPENAKCRRYFTEADDGLSKNWGKKAVWCNPPYHRKLIGDWVIKAFKESRKGATVVMLIPTHFREYAWWKQYCLQGQVRFVHPFIRFQKCDGDGTCLKDVVIIVFGKNYEAQSSGPVICKPESKNGNGTRGKSSHTQELLAETV